MTDETSKPAIMSNLSHEVETITKSVVEMIEQHITYDGLVPEIGERSGGEVYDFENERWIKYDAESMGGVEV